jgi:hypothetical protein
MRYPRLRYYDKDGWLGASDALLMCFYMPHPNERIAPAVIRAVEFFRERIRPYQFVWNDTGDGQAEPLDDASWERTRGKTLEPGPNRGAFLGLNGKLGVNDLHVDYRGLSVVPLPWPERKDDVSVLYLRLPTEFLEERGPERVRALALELAAELPFSSGYVDFVLCVSWAANSVEALKLIRSRYQGVHLALSGATMNVNTWVDGVHWMNFLGQPVLGKLGGVSGLRERGVLPGGSIQEMSGMSGDRVLITLGERPEVGDVEAGQTLPLHRALARLLEPYLYQRKSLLGHPAPEELLRWDRRFLD